MVTPQHASLHRCGVSVMKNWQNKSRASTSKFSKSQTMISFALPHTSGQVYTPSAYMID